MTVAAQTKTKPAVKNPSQVKKAVALGKDMMKKGDVTKADVARKMFELIKDEDREVIAQTFMEGAKLTSKGAMTYVYNIRRKVKKVS